MWLFRVGDEPDFCDINQLYSFLPKVYLSIPFYIFINNCFYLLFTYLHYYSNLYIYPFRECTPLHYAAKISNHELVELLLEHGADLSAVDRHGWSVLHYAVRSTIYCTACMDEILDYDAFSMVRGIGCALKGGDLIFF